MKTEPKEFEDELNGSTGENRETKNRFVVKDVCDELYAADDIDQDEKGVKVIGKEPESLVSDGIENHLRWF